ncbi:MAG: hypothetical protein KJ737_24605 [Proteobacteria bacterium]|nr:hypothetical protein [Pseudomonadota bacterium]
MQDKQTLIEIWYAGLNDAFRKTRGPMATAGCHDRPQIRLFYYGLVGMVFISMSVGLIIVIPFLKEIIWLAGICAVVAMVTLYQAVTFFRAFIQVKQAVDQGKDTDYADPLRFKVMEQALSWGIKKGIVMHREGKYEMKQG